MNPSQTDKFLSLLRRVQRVRMADWLLYSMALMALVWFMAPQQLPVAVYKLALLSLAAVTSYWIDRSLFPYARPDVLLLGEEVGVVEHESETSFLDIRGVVSFAEAELSLDSPLDMATNRERLALGAACMLRRALIVGFAMLAVSLGA